MNGMARAHSALGFPRGRLSFLFVAVAAYVMSRAEELNAYVEAGVESVLSPQWPLGMRTSSFPVTSQQLVLLQGRIAGRDTSCFSSEDC